MEKDKAKRLNDSKHNLYVRIPKFVLPFDKQQQRHIVEEYFTEHLPSIIEEEDKWLIHLERPCELYGCYSFDQHIKSILQWWNINNKISDIPFQKRILTKGLIALEDQWMVYSWSRYFRKIKKIPEEIILLHIDDHQDMMAPRIGIDKKGQLFDFITKKFVFLDIPHTINSAIISGAIGKGSILTPLIWTIKTIHIRHLCFRPSRFRYHDIIKSSSKDLMFETKNERISIDLKPTTKKNFTNLSNYQVSPDIDEWLEDLPRNIPIFFHIDMDYFNNRFDGNSNWKLENNRVHEMSLDQQLIQMKNIFSKLQQKKLFQYIVDTCIGISPGFYPSEYCEISIPKILKYCKPFL